MPFAVGLAGPQVGRRNRLVEKPPGLLAAASTLPVVPIFSISTALLPIPGDAWCSLTPGMPAMLQRSLLLLLIVLSGATAGCCCHERRVWTCDDGTCAGQGLLSGRNGGCSDCGVCDQCGHAPGECSCGFFSRLHRRLTCGEGCGEMYWGDWISDPPAPCDPCDECTGQFVGRRCCPPRPGMRLGGRFCDGSCPEGNCHCQGVEYEPAAGY